MRYILDLAALVLSPPVHYAFFKLDFERALILVVYVTILCKYEYVKTSLTFITERDP